MSNVKISCRNVWKIFGPTPEHIAETIKPETAVSLTKKPNRDNL